MTEVWNFLQNILTFLGTHFLSYKKSSSRSFENSIILKNSKAKKTKLMRWTLSIFFIFYFFYFCLKNLDRWKSRVYCCCCCSAGEREPNLFLGCLALGLEDLHDDLLFLNKESTNNLFTDGLVAQNTSVSPEDLLVSETVSGAFAGPHWLDTLELDTGHGALGHGWSLLQVLEDQFTTGCSNGAPSVGLGVVRQSPTVSDTLNHLEFNKLLSTIFVRSLRL